MKIGNGCRTLTEKKTKFSRLPPIPSMRSGKTRPAIHHPIKCTFLSLELKQCMLLAIVSYKYIRAIRSSRTSRKSKVKPHTTCPVALVAPFSKTGSWRHRYGLGRPSQGHEGHKVLELPWRLLRAQAVAGQLIIHLLGHRSSSSPPAAARRPDGPTVDIVPSTIRQCIL